VHREIHHFAGRGLLLLRWRRMLLLLLLLLRWRRMLLLLLLGPRDVCDKLKADCLAQLDSSSNTAQAGRRQRSPALLCQDCIHPLYICHTLQMACGHLCCCC
jgi:hypothetical protein